MTPSACNFARFGMKPRPFPEVVNSAQTSESQKIKKVAALKDGSEEPQSALYEGGGEI